MKWFVVALGTTCASFLLEACQYGYTISGEQRGDRLILHSDVEPSHNVLGRFWQGRFSRPPLCIDFLTVTSSGNRIWQIEGPNVPSCSATFPIIYGQALPGFKQPVLPKPLKAGQRYIVEVSGMGGDGHGTFIWR